MMKRVLFVFALSIMTLSMSAQIQEGAKLDNKQATLDKGKGTENQELTTINSTIITARISAFLTSLCAFMQI